MADIFKAYDWRDLTRQGKFTFQCVSPSNLNDVYGELEGVDLSSSSLEWAYYTDTRTSGQLSIIGDGWVRGSYIRAIYEIPEWGFSTVLGTYIVTSDDSSRANGAWHYDVQLQSTLYGLSTDKLVRPRTIATNASALSAIKTIVSEAQYYQGVYSGAKDVKVKTPQVLETGTTRLAALYSLCTLTSNRLDVDPRGRVTVSPYVLPSAKVPKYRIDLTDPRGIAHDDLSRSTNWHEMVDTVAVSFKYSESVKKGDKTESVQREINAYAKVSANLHQAHQKRGYTITDFRSLSELSPQTQAQAQKLANQYLKEQAAELVEWELTTEYLPLTEGDVVELVVPDGMAQYRGVRKCLVKNVTLNMFPLQMQLTLKETASGDTET